MLNAEQTVDTLPKVIQYANPGVEYAMAHGQMNTEEQRVLDNIRASIRRGHPQMQTWGLRPQPVCLVGSGPSLKDTEKELRDLLWQGADLVTLNGAYQWCVERNLRPQTQIVMDARACNARFVHPEVPRCNYVLASQCAPELWDAVEGREHVWIFHPVVKTVDGAAAKLLDTYYQGQWVGVGGGTTVATRAIHLLRNAGYLRFHLFGIDCCWRDDQHHAFAQPENDADKAYRITYGVQDQPETARTFTVAPWMLKQLEDFLTIMAINGRQFLLDVHGDGLLAHALQTLGMDARVLAQTEE